MIQQRRTQNRQKKGWKTNLGDVDSRVSEEEKLVCARSDDGPKQAEDPCTECRGRYRGIIGVGYRGSDFGVRGFIFDSDSHRVKVGIVDEGLRFSSHVSEYNPTLERGKERTDICDAVMELRLGGLLDVERRPLHVFGRHWQTSRASLTQTQGGEGMGKCGRKENERTGRRTGTSSNGSL